MYIPRPRKEVPRMVKGKALHRDLPLFTVDFFSSSPSCPLTVNPSSFFQVKVIARLSLALFV
jgi:hypothetical protein